MYLKNKDIPISFRLDNETYTTLFNQYKDMTRLFPKLTFSEYLRNILMIHAVKSNEN